MLISVSMLTAYDYCKRKLFLEKVLGIKEEPKEETTKGKIRHKVFEEIARIEPEIILSITKSDYLDDIKRKYSNAAARILRETILYHTYTLKSLDIKPLELYKELWPLFEDEIATRATGVWNLIQKYLIYGYELIQKLPRAEPEYKIISTKLNLIGVIDRIEFIDNSPVPIELKSGKMPIEGVWPGHKIQLAAYSLLIEEKYEKVVKEGYVFYLDSNEKRRVVFNPFMKSEVIDLISKVNELLEQKTAPELAQNTNKCVSCRLRQICHDKELIDDRLQKTLNIS
jgi:CRISPR-associated protein Cas4